MDINKIKSHWDAFIYNEQETETCDVNFLRSVIGSKPKKILEIACGSGRILAPLANDGHYVTGLDCNEDMLSYIQPKIKLIDCQVKCNKIREKIYELPRQVRDNPNAFWVYC